MIVNMRDSETGGVPSKEIRRQRMLDPGQKAAEILGARFGLCITGEIPWITVT